jgi:hypothetical protein
MPYDAGSFLPGAPLTSSEFSRVVFTRAVTFAAGLAGSQGNARIAATGDAIFTLSQWSASSNNTTQFGTCTFAAGASTCIFASSSGASFQAQDVLIVTAPAVIDPTLADVSITLSGTR